jgi:hypothetical protein
MSELTVFGPNDRAEIAVAIAIRTIDPPSRTLVLRGVMWGKVPSHSSMRDRWLAVGIPVSGNLRYGSPSDDPSDRDRDLVLDTVKAMWGLFPTLDGPPRGSSVRVGPRLTFDAKKQQSEGFVARRIRKTVSRKGDPDTTWELVWDPKRPSSMLVNGTDWSDSAIRYDSGQIAYDFPERIPDFVKRAVERTFKEVKKTHPSGSPVRVGPRLALDTKKQQAEYDDSPEGLVGRRIAVAHRLMQSVRRRVETVGQNDRWGPYGYGTDLWRSLIRSRVLALDIPAVAKTLWARRIPEIGTPTRRPSTLTLDKLAARYRGQGTLEQFEDWSMPAQAQFRVELAEETGPSDLVAFEKNTHAVVSFLDSAGLRPVEDWVRAIEEADRAEGLAVP